MAFGNCRNVVILGGGIIGASTAYYLSKRGVACTIVERSSIAAAASGELTRHATGSTQKWRQHGHGRLMLGDAVPTHLHIGVHMPAPQPLHADGPMQSHSKGGQLSAGKAGGFLALEWQDGSGTGPLARRSFQLHSQLAEELGADTGYRRVRTLAVTCSAQPGKLLSRNSRRGGVLAASCAAVPHAREFNADHLAVAGAQAQRPSSAQLPARPIGLMAQSSRRRWVGCLLTTGAQRHDAKAAVTLSIVDGLDC